MFLATLLGSRGGEDVGLNTTCVSAGDAETGLPDLPRASPLDREYEGKRGPALKGPILVVPVSRQTTPKSQLQKHIPLNNESKKID